MCFGIARNGTAGFLKQCVYPSTILATEICGGGHEGTACSMHGAYKVKLAHVHILFCLTNIERPFIKLGIIVVLFQNVFPTSLCHMRNPNQHAAANNRVRPVGNACMLKFGCCSSRCVVPDVATGTWAQATSFERGRLRVFPVCRPGAPGQP